MATLGGGTRVLQMRKPRLVKADLPEVTQLALTLTRAQIPETMLLTQGRFWRLWCTCSWGPHRPTAPPRLPPRQGALAHWMFRSPTSFPRASHRALGHPISCECHQPRLGTNQPSWPGSFWWEIPSQRLFDRLPDKQLGKWKMGILLVSFRFF